MAKVKSTSTNSLDTVKKSRPGVHAKTKTSRSKNAKNYKKKYRGQGR
jgi:hypothetical protein